MKRVPVFVILLALAVPLRAAGAQDSTSGHFCFRARPKPKCDWFAVTEFSVRRPLRTLPDIDPIMDLDLGVMANVGRRSAIGGTFTIGGDEQTQRHGLGLRYRRWLSSSVAAEVGLSRLSWCETTGPSTCERDRAGFGAQAAVTLSDFVGVTVAYEHFNAASSDPGDPNVWSYPAGSQVTGGVKFGSYLGPLVMLGLGVLIAATW